MAALTGVLSYRSARWNVRKELEVDLRQERLKAFKELWSLSEPLAKYARPDPVTAASMRRLAANLRHWYFAQGGMFLSNESRNAYFAFQDALEVVTTGATDDDQPLDEETFEAIRVKGSKLRSALRMAFKGFPQM